MDFLPVLQATISEFDKARIRYALIGGFAMGLRGIQRATMDLDFILLLEDLKKAAAILEGQGYRCEFQSENVSHFLHPQLSWGRIDLLHAFRAPSLGMLKRAERVEVAKSLSIPVVQVEDLMGLKVQAAVNDRSRAVRDWQDIQMILEEMGRRRQVPDWQLLEDYLGIFSLEEKLPLMKEWHGAAH